MARSATEASHAASPLGEHLVDRVHHEVAKNTKGHEEVVLTKRTEKAFANLFAIRHGGLSSPKTNARLTAALPRAMSVFDELLTAAIEGSEK